MREKGEVLLMTARERCSPDMRVVAQKEGITAANAFKDPIDKVEVRLAPVTDMTPVKLPVPVLLGTGQADKVLVPRRQFAAVEALCSAGSDIVWKTYPGATHNGGLLASFPNALALFKTVLAGQKVASNCSSVVEAGVPTGARPGTSCSTIEQNKDRTIVRLPLRKYPRSRCGPARDRRAIA